MPSQPVFSLGTIGRRVRLSRGSTPCERVREAGGPHVITQGEPHPGNVLRTLAGLRLIDWDVSALARPERDL